ncbi:MAG TPA: cyclic nucleotide-binding domain-containing protein [Vicinamibacteria bacterium]|nr:cyclic nucleotide-binding domain-containing protein [Vicinamibacteria bacterium]
MRLLPIQGAVRQQVEEALSASPWFRALRERDATAPAGARQTDRLLAQADLVEYGAGEVILQQGYPSDSLLVLVRGSVSVRVGDEGRPQRAIGRLRPSASLGEIGLLLEEPRSATVVAAEGVLALRFGAEAFHEIFRRVPEFGLDTARHLARRLRALTGMVPMPESDVEAADAPALEPADAPAPAPKAAASPLPRNVGVLPDDEPAR